MQVAKNITKTPDFSGKSFLLIEDSKDTQFILTLLLEDAGAIVETADYGRKGVELALERWHARSSYSQILIDVQLPGISGFDVARELRSKEYPGLLIAMTARCLLNDYEASTLSGFNGYLNKASGKGTFLATLDLFFDIERDERSALYEPDELPIDLQPINVTKEYLYRLQESASALERAYERDDTDKARLLLEVLRSGKVFGFPEVSKAAQVLLEALRGDKTQVNSGEYLHLITSALSKAEVREHIS